MKTSIGKARRSDARESERRCCGRGLAVWWMPIKVIQKAEGGDEPWSNNEAPK